MKKQNKFLTILFSFALFVTSQTVIAETKVVDEKPEKKLTLEEKLDISEKEVEQIKGGKSVFIKAPEKGKNGVGPAASKVYEIDSGLSIGGYGEVNFSHKAGKNQKGDGVARPHMSSDATRGVVYFGYKYNDWIVLNTEIELEHVKESYLEFAYLDFMLNDAINIRAGLILTPMGLLNELHESPTFLSVNRPITEKYIIPTTWRENGFGLYGNIAGFDYRAYAMSGYQGEGKVSASNGIRKGRWKGSEVKTDDIALTARVDYVNIPGLLVGVSGYTSNGTHKTQDYALNTTILDAHLDWQWKGLFVRGLFAIAQISDTARDIQENHAADFSGSIGEQMMGYYFEVGYDIFKFFNFNQQLITFVRYENLNTVSKLSTEAEAYEKANPKAYDKYKQTLVTFGMSYKPIPQVAIKADFRLHQTKAEDGVNVVDLGVSYLF